MTLRGVLVALLVGSCIGTAIGVLIGTAGRELRSMKWRHEVAEDKIFNIMAATLRINERVAEIHEAVVPTSTASRCRCP